jgi:signal peptidase I
MPSGLPYQPMQPAHAGTPMPAETSGQVAPVMHPMYATQSASGTQQKQSALLKQLVHDIMPKRSGESAQQAQPPLMPFETAQFQAVPPQPMPPFAETFQDGYPPQGQPAVMPAFAGATPSGEVFQNASMQHVAAVESGGRGNKFGRIFFNVLFYAFIIAMLGGGLLFALSNNPAKSYFGYRLYTVKTPSMTPAADGSSPAGGFRAGDTILVKLTKPEDIRVGDIITFVPGDDPRVYLTHRVVEVLDGIGNYQDVAFVTKGDANNSSDSPITGDMLIGKKIFAIPGTGTILTVFQENIWTSLLAAISGMGAILMFRLYFTDRKKAIMQKQQQQNPQISPQPQM